MVKYLAFIIVTFFSVTSLVGQSNLLKEANLLFEKGQYDKAISIYSVYNRNNPGDDLGLSYLGICQYYLGQTEQAIRTLSSALEVSKKPKPNTYLFLAKSFHAEGNFQRAADGYKTFLGKAKAFHPQRKQVHDAIRRCGSGLRLSGQKANAIVETAGTNINSSRDDYGAVLSPTYDDKIYFSSVRTSNMGGNRVDSEAGNYTSDVYTAAIVNGSWDNVQPLGGNLNSGKDDQVLDFSKNGQSILLWNSVNGYSGDIIVDTFSNDGNLHRGTFSAPINGKIGDSGLHFYNDTTILFYSNRPEGFGGFDLYAAFYNGNQWSKAYNLGSEINSAYDEISPFLSTDGSSLYFASNRPESMGGFDNFVSRFSVGKQSWSQPKNLGTPINSGLDDFHLRLDTKGLQGYMTSNRPGGEGLLDIYAIYFKKYLAEQSTDRIISSLSSLQKIAKDNGNDEETVVLDETQLRKYVITPVYFDEEDDIIKSGNQNNIDPVLRILKDNPTVNVEIIGGSNKSASIEFDLYFSIKRAEAIANYLQKKGIQNDRIICRGVGQNYPLTRHEINGQSILLAQKQNRRVEFIFTNTEGLPIEIAYKAPITTNPKFKMPGIQRLKNQSKGLSYRVSIARTPNMYNGDVIVNYPDPMIDRPLGRKLYRYTVGMYGTYQSALFMKTDLISKGVTAATVVPFVDGREVGKIEAGNLLSQYPDLASFITQE